VNVAALAGHGMAAHVWSPERSGNEVNHALLDLQSAGHAAERRRLREGRAARETRGPQHTVPPTVRGRWRQMTRPAERTLWP
jgi:hypothetical protein